MVKKSKKSSDRYAQFYHVTPKHKKGEYDIKQCKNHGKLRSYMENSDIRLINGTKENHIEYIRYENYPKDTARYNTSKFKV